MRRSPLNSPLALMSLFIILWFPVLRMLHILAWPLIKDWPGLSILSPTKINLNLRLRLLKNLINNNKYTHINTKLLIYKSLLKPAWTYGLQLWGNAKKTNINKIQTFQNIALRKLVNAPPYVSNHTIHTDLKMPTVSEEAKAYYKRFHSHILTHPNPLVRNLVNPTIPGNPPRRLKRKWCRDLL